MIKNEYQATNQAHFPTLQSASGDQSCTPLCVHALSQHYQTGKSYDTFPKLSDLLAQIWLWPDQGYHIKVIL